jgi:hypothetical protein
LGSIPINPWQDEVRFLNYILKFYVGRICFFVEGKAFAVLAGAIKRWLQPSSIDPILFA